MGFVIQFDRWGNRLKCCGTPCSKGEMERDPDASEPRVVPAPRWEQSVSKPGAQIQVIQEMGGTAGLGPT